MKDILIRNVPDSVALRITEKANEKGQTRQEYLLELILNVDLEYKIRERQRVLLEVIKNNSDEIRSLRREIERL